LTIEPKMANVSVSEMVGVDRKLLDDVAVQLGVDPGDSDQVADVAAVAMTRLAWRDGPVEDWHSFRYRRINEAEMMRANAATTRAVRDVMDHGGSDGVFGRVGKVLADPCRRLPDGRRVVDVAPSRSEWEAYRGHVTACCTRWDALAASFGVAAVLVLLACRGARFNWAWWRSTGWPWLVEEFIRRLDEPRRWNSAWEIANRRALGDPPGDLSSQDLRSVLLAGPDRLNAATASYCLRAGISALGPQACGLPSVRRRLLPSGYFDLVDI
jgi:hypothetical protein